MAENQYYGTGRRSSAARVFIKPATVNRYQPASLEQQYWPKLPAWQFNSRWNRSPGCRETDLRHHRCRLGQAGAIYRITRASEDTTSPPELRKAGFST